MADVNSDGFPDYVSTNWNNGGLQVALGNGNGTFIAVNNSTASGCSDSLTCADFDGDGRPDVVCGTPSGQWFRGLGNGLFTPVSGAPSSSGEYLVSGDVSGDGRPDVVFASGAGSLIVWQTVCQ